MTLSRTETDLIVTIPLSQDAQDFNGDVVGRIPNIMGVQAGDEQGFCQLADRTYKWKDPDICDFIVKTYYPEEVFEKKCAELGINYFKYDTCAECKKVIYGACTMNDKGTICFECERT